MSSTSDFFNEILQDVVIKKADIKEENEEYEERIRKKRDSGLFKPWGRHSDLPQGQYYLDRVNFVLNILQHYLERVVVRNEGAKDLTPEIRNRLIDLYCVVLKDNIKKGE